MPVARRKFSEEEKRNIVGLAKQSGISKVLRDYKLSYSVFSRWKIQLAERNVPVSEQHITHLKTENLLLKKIVAEQALQLQIEKERKPRTT